MAGLSEVGRGVLVGSELPDAEGKQQKLDPECCDYRNEFPHQMQPQGWFSNLNVLQNLPGNVVSADSDSREAQ